MFQIEFTPEAMGDLRRAADGTEFLLTPVEDFDQEIARTRQNAKLMALLDERARQTRTVPLEEVKRQLGLDE
jgi:hypothetical protein